MLIGTKHAISVVCSLEMVASLLAPNIDGLVQESRNSIANAPELRFSCTTPSM